MKKTLLLLTFLGLYQANAQLTVSPNPFNINSGTITVTYGASGDYSLFNPNSDPNLYLYTGLETDGVTTTWDYHDTWNNLSSLVPLTWNSSANAYVATFDIGARNYTQDSSGTLMTIPSGTSVNNWYFIIRNGDGSAQSGDLKGTDYGFSASLETATFNTFEIKLTVSNNSIFTNAQGKIELEIYTILGQKVASFSRENNNSNLEIPLNLNSNGIYIARLTNDNQTKTLKFNY